MLRLAAETDPGWGAGAIEHLPELLLEQAHLEKKAAASAVTLLFRYPQHGCLQEPLSRLAREELEHFERSLEQLRSRGIEFGRQRPGPYAQQLLRCAREDDPDRLLDHLLCSAAIEARSCERMKLLAEALRQPEPELSSFYRDLVASEARHHHQFVELAKELFPAEVVDDRLHQVLAHEAFVVREFRCVGRLHG